ncbi:MAG: TetR/AcrR family transcriptional regulator [Solirubrobacterales bacterium]
MTPPRSRQRNARGEGGRLRLEISAAATRLIDNSDRLTLRAIAREAGIAGPSIYDHFPGVTEIRNEMIRSFYDDLVERIDEANRGATDPVERLQNTCLAYVGYGADFPRRYALLFQVERDQEEKAAVGARGAAALDTLVEAIAECKAAGRSSSDDPYRDAVAVWAALHGLTVLRASRPNFDLLHADSFMQTLVGRLASVGGRSKA